MSTATADDLYHTARSSAHALDLSCASLTLKPTWEQHLSSSSDSPTEICVQRGIPGSIYLRSILRPNIADFFAASRI